MVLSGGFRAAINPFKMHLDLEECDRPGSTSYLTPGSVLVFQIRDVSSLPPLTAEDGILD